MKKIPRRVRIALVAALLVAIAVLVPNLVDSREPTRELRITARDMSFHVETLEGPNPALQLSAGAEVKVIFRNEDRGMLHDFGIPEWGIHTGGVAWGNERSVTFKVPKGSSALSYICTPHSAMMSGRIIVSQ